MRIYKLINMYKDCLLHSSVEKSLNDRNIHFWSKLEKISVSRIGVGMRTEKGHNNGQVTSLALHREILDNY